MPPDHDRFPCLGLAYRALRAGGTLPVVLNAANEVAVEAFLDGKLGFTAIPRVIERTMDAHAAGTRLNAATWCGASTPGRGSTPATWPAS